MTKRIYSTFSAFLRNRPSRAKATDRAIAAPTHCLSRGIGGGRGDPIARPGVELLAALGPTCWLAFIEVLAGFGKRMGSAPGRAKDASPRNRSHDAQEPSRAA